MGLVLERFSTLDPIVIDAALRPLGDQAPPEGYVAGLLDTTFTTFHLEHYARVVADMSALRSLYQTGKALATDAVAGQDPGDIINRALERLQVGRRELPKYIKLGDAIEAYFVDMKSNEIQIETGTEEFDHVLGGWTRGSMHTIAASTSIGKSALMAEQVVKQAKKGRSSAFISLELIEHEIVERILARETGLSNQRLRDLRDEDLPVVATAQGDLGELPLYVAVMSSDSVMAVCALVERLQREVAVEFVAIDYLQLLSAGRKDNDVADLTQVCHAIKALAVRLNIPILIGCQLNRKIDDRAEANATAVPRLSDLKGSGSIEQDSDVVVLMWADRRHADVRHLAVAKNRNGPLGTFKLKFRAAQGRFEPFKEESNPDEPW
jgi:replicative DNA helicase